jgi:hypothetical protein
MKTNHYPRLEHYVKRLVKEPAEVILFEGQPSYPFPGLRSYATNTD